MFKVHAPEDMSETFARAFNARSIEGLLGLYEKTAVLRSRGTTLSGKGQIRAELERVLRAPGTMVCRPNFCMVNGDIALVRADYKLVDGTGKVRLAGSSAEVLRRQADGCWLFVIDHGTGASRAAIELE